MLVASTKIGFSGESSRSSAPSLFLLFLEATQRKTVPTVIAALRVDPAAVEMQATDIEAGHRRRPIEPGGADVTHCPKASVRSRVATARGCRWALESGLPMATCIVRALVEIDQTTLGCLVNFLLQQSRGAARHSNRAVSTLTKARAVTRTHPPQGRAQRASYWPSGREIFREKPSLRVPSSTEPRPGWRRLAHSAGVQFLYLLPNFRASAPPRTTPPNVLCPRAFSRTAVSKRRAARRLPLGRNAQRLLLPASTPNAPSRASSPKNCSARENWAFLRKTPLAAVEKPLSRNKLRS
jgi:hypothetical protein